MTADTFHAEGVVISSYLALYAKHFADTSFTDYGTPSSRVRIIQICHLLYPLVVLIYYFPIIGHRNMP